VSRRLKTPDELGYYGEARLPRLRVWVDAGDGTSVTGMHGDSTGHGDFERCGRTVHEFPHLDSTDDLPGWPTGYTIDLEPHTGRARLLNPDGHVLDREALPSELTDA
jgi:hypothetical protein